MNDEILLAIFAVLAIMGALGTGYILALAVHYRWLDWKRGKVQRHMARIRRARR